MKIRKDIIFTFLVLVNCSCSWGLKQEIDKEAAENLIQQGIQNFDQSQLERSNAQNVVFADSDYLFVINSFNGDFNGYVFSRKNKPDFKMMRFETFYITHHDNTENNWTKVYGKW